MVERSSVLTRRRSPLSRLIDEISAGSSDGASLREIPFLAQIGIRAEPGSASASALESSLGGALPGGVGKVSQVDDGRSVLWLGPDEFLVIARDEADGGPDPAALTDELVSALGDLPGQVVDLSANRTTLELSGSNAQDVLDKSCRMDLDLVAFPAGTAVNTLIESVGIILWRVEENTWRVMPRASFSTHVARWLLDGMREYI